MRIAVVCPYDLGRFGGVQNQAILMTQRLIAEGHEAWIVGPGDHRAPASEQVPVRSLGKSRMWSVNDSAAPIKVSPAVVPRLRAAVAAADVVHVHEPLMPLVSLAARWVGKPLIGTFHADPSNFVRRLYRFFPPLRWHLRSFSALVAVSATARTAVETMGDIHLIPNGIDTEYPKLARDPASIAFVGRNDPRKGLATALAALRQVRDTVPEAHLHVITPDDVPAEPGVTVHRGVDDATKAALLARSQLFVAPNTRGESFGLIVAEGMAAGAACVVSDIPAFAAVAGEAARLVTPGSAEAMAEAIAVLLRDEAAARRLGELGQERAQEFSIDRTVAAYLPLYEAALR